MPAMNITTAVMGMEYDGMPRGSSEFIVPRIGCLHIFQNNKCLWICFQNCFLAGTDLFIRNNRNNHFKRIALVATFPIQ